MVYVVAFNQGPDSTKHLSTWLDPTEKSQAWFAGTGAPMAEQSFCHSDQKRLVLSIDTLCWKVKTRHPSPVQWFKSNATEGKAVISSLSCMVHFKGIPFILDYAWSKQLVTFEILNWCSPFVISVGSCTKSYQSIRQKNYWFDVFSFDYKLPACTEKVAILLFLSWVNIKPSSNTDHLFRVVMR